MIKCERCLDEYDEGDAEAAGKHGETLCKAPERADPTAALTSAIGDLKDQITKSDDELERRINDAVKAATGGEPSTPSRKEGAPADIQIRDQFDQLGYDKVETGTSDTKENRELAMRSNLELAMMIFEGTKRIASVGEIPAPEHFRNAWTKLVFEGPDGPPMISKDGEPQRAIGSDRDGKDANPQRAMDTAETGFGLELMGVQYVREMWQAARNNDSIVGSIREIPLLDNSGVIPIDGDLAEMLFVSESTSASATAYSTTKTGSGQVTLSPKKFTIQQVWSAELNEDSIIAYTPFLREKLNMSATLYLGSAYYNGDTTDAGTGNINSDDANPADTKHYLAWDGIRHYFLVDTTGQGKDMAAVLDPKEINVARGKLNGADDDIDNLIKNINWGQNARDLRLVMDWDTYMSMLDLDDVQTIDKYGAQATVVTGELGSYKGIPIISPAYASKTEADGFASTTEASNTKGQITLFNPMGFLGGNRRGVQLFFDRIQRTDQFLFELYTRRAFTKFGENVAAGIYDITV